MVWVKERKVRVVRRMRGNGCGFRLLCPVDGLRFGTWISDVLIVEDAKGRSRRGKRSATCNVLGSLKAACFDDNDSSLNHE